MKSLDHQNHKIELLAPAGNMEKLEIALHYGADAVYLAGKDYSLRNFSTNFTLDEMQKALQMVHAHDKKAYIAVNIFPANEDLPHIESYINQISTLKPDGIIVADPAILSITRNIAPQIPIHLSTQANTTNWRAAKFWENQGVKRINTARELTLAQIEQIARSCELEIEAFVHGAMCIAYSGRCLLSSFMAQRSSNQGMCCQPCRFKYAVVEELRPGQYFDVDEDQRGTYIFNSRDLCMISHIGQMVQSGITTLKIEGRMKSIHYAATTVKTYREAIDHYYQAPDRFNFQPYWQTELDKITNRGYCTGFYLGAPAETAPRYNAPQPSNFPLVAKVLKSLNGGKAYIEVRNQIRPGQTIEIITPKGPPIEDTIQCIEDADGRLLKVAQPGSLVTVQLKTRCHALDLFRGRIT